MYSLSTCWNSYRHTDGEPMLEEIAAMGFEYAELSHGIRLSLVPGILKAVERGVIRISTLHNFCPLPLGVNHAAPNIFKFTAADQREQDNAFKHTIKTLDLAETVQARAIVLHMGAVDLKDYTEKLVGMMEKGKHETPKFDKIREEVVEKREKKKEPFCQRAYQMLERLEEQAGVRGIRLGIENREALEEIPFESDFFLFFKQFSSPTVGYWHDCGHAQIKENLGFISHVLHLESMAERLIGFHIHDVQFPAKDHCAPGSGMIAFDALAPYVRPDHIKVFELKPGMPDEDVRAGVAHVKSLWGEE